MQRWVIPILFSLIVVFGGCGPKYAKKDTLSTLEEAKLAAEKAEAKVKDLESELATLQEKVGTLTDQLNQLTQDRDALKGKIESRCHK